MDIVSETRFEIQILSQMSGCLQKFAEEKLYKNKVLTIFVKI